MSTRELPKAYDPKEIEPRWYKFWLEHDLFHADASVPKRPYSVVIPPPNVTGSLHMGHALGSTVQDVLVRWHRMRGDNAMWLPGTDHAGISTQIMVERDLQKTEQKSRHDLGREAFVARVWAWKEKYGGRIVEQMRAMGFSLDWSRMRFTLDDELSRAVRETFARLYEEGLIYRARRLINWCTKDQTALSDLEVDANEEQGSIWEIKYGELVVATTRPETMLGDTAVAVHPDDPRYKHLVGKTVRLPLTDRDIPIIADPILVDMEFGTGAVKVTPGHDFNDFETGLRHGLEQLSIIDSAGKLQAPAPAKYVGLSVPEARKAVLADLEAQGLLVATKPHKLSIGRCERCGTIAEPLLSMQWFVKTAPLAAPAIEAVEQGKTKFVPELWSKTYMHWMRNIKDWCISRQLWWGHQIPAWYCADQHITVARETPTACKTCGKTQLRQEEDVLDTWFSSALWPFSTLGWPESTRELKTFYPTNVLVTAKDIIFFWVARMMMMGLHFLKKVPFQHVYITALVVDENGEKMSKTRGNVIDPLDVAFGASKDDLLAKVDKPDAKKHIEKTYPQGMEAMGVDALRYALAYNAVAGRDLPFSMQRARSMKEFVNKIWNAARFVLMNVEGFDADAWVDAEPAAPRSLADRWILSRLQRVTGEVNRALEDYRLDEASQALYNFFWGEYCAWYLEVAKPVLQGSDDAAKRTAQGTLVSVIETSMRLFHPIMPFVTEEIWQALPKASVHAGSSIMTTLFPEVDEQLVDADAEARFDLLMKVAVAIRNIRSEYNVSPKETMEVRVRGDLHRGVLTDGRGIVERAANARLVFEGAEGGKNTARALVGADLELYVPLGGLIDPATERARLLKDAEKADKAAADVARKLENKSFVERAPAEVVEENRQRLADERARASRLREAAQLLEA
jgi:valyl-tRNA synthetase